MASPILELEGVSKNFGGLKVIDNLSFKVMPAERVALIGPNGAGKTTAFNLITDLYRVDSGRIVLDGRDITTVPSRKRIGLGIARSFQNIRLMPHLTVLENVMIGQSAHNASALAMFQPVNLFPGNRWRVHAREALGAAGLGQYALETTGALPYGIQKRIELVRALLSEPRILLLDEPAAGLNPSETEELRQQLNETSRRGVTLIVVEHDMHFIGAFCQRVIVLNFGCKIAECSPHEAQADPLVREAYLGSDEELGQTHAA
ncbi:MAG: ABC transporter ATP-binding protein [Betaproteobacteria bacterium]|nr:ABC transporter ATP-binding protein [Betaproteobacteria bacterium]